MAPLLQAKQPTQRRRLTLIAGSVTVFGLSVVLLTHAAGPYTMSEAETGTLSGKAASAGDAQASGSSYVRFNSATPAPGGNSCPAYPAFPDASCTGVPAGTTLSSYTGPMTISTANTVIDGKIINGCIDITAAGVIIKNSKISCSSGLAVYSHVTSGTRLTIQDTEIICGDTDGSTAVGDTNINTLRLNIHGCENGYDADDNLDIQENYIHDLHQSDIAHTDGLQSAIGNNITINHSTIYANDGTSAVNINNCNPAQRACPSSSNTTVSNNLLAGGAFTLYCPMVTTTNFQVTNNRFSYKFWDPRVTNSYPGSAGSTNYPWKPLAGNDGVGAFGYSSDCGGEIKSGNVIHETGQALSL